ncbi:MAG TPA: dihydrolipoamide acetyltransferase family protein [Gemmataceae bacterium]|jgi:pyruvate dehydrogenase E2 component (dihydrolipoamide acetyltransferase)/2-oxoisovalerate dehydrogenase E2 component (dihydrolipoyl transacylase)|nr:dihydrolipoamide acetyltransferase family protein [Gemmataceae bacterium]
MEFKLPELGEGVYEAELVSWHVQPGDVVESGQNLLEVLTDKATMEVPAPFAGTIGPLHAEPGATLKVGDVVLEYQPAGAAQPSPTPASQKPSTTPATASASKSKPKRHVTETAVPVAAKPDIIASHVNGNPPPVVAAPTNVQAAPSVRYMARKLGIDLAQLHGSGPGGRILLDDLTRRIQKAPDRGAAKDEHPEFGVAGTRIPMKGLRRKIAEHMVAAKRDIPHYSYVDEFDATPLVQLRDTLKPDFAAAGIKLTYLAFVVKAVATALKEVPIVNSSLLEESGEIALHAHYHIGIAVSTPAGLVVPVIHDADQKDLSRIAAEIDQLSSQARAGKIQLADIQGGTFTVTSIGNVGGLFSTPIINQPQVGILGLGKMVRRPVYDNAGAIRPADMQYLSFSFDHRIVDGAVGAAFGNAVLRLLRQPARLLLSGTGFKR